MAISGTDLLEVPTIYYIKPKAYEISRNIPRSYAQKYGTNVITSILGSWNFDQWEFQHPKMEVLYHIRQYFVGIFPEIKALYMVGTSNRSVPEMASDLR